MTDDKKRRAWTPVTELRIVRAAIERHQLHPENGINDLLEALEADVIAEALR